MPQPETPEVVKAWNEKEGARMKILFIAFHDVVPGTGMDHGYDEVRDIIVFNSLSWEVRDWIEMDLNFDAGQVVTISGLQSGEEEIDVEVITFARHEDDSLRYARIGFVPTVPAMGYKVYKILEREPKVVTVVNLLEEEDEIVKKELKKAGTRITLDMKPFEIVTLKIKQ